MSLRDEWIEKFKNKIDEANNELDRLSAKAQESSGDVQKQYETQMAKLRERREQAKDKLSEIREAGEAAFDDLAQGAENAWNSIKNAVSSARDKF